MKQQSFMRNGINRLQTLWKKYKTRKNVPKNDCGPRGWRLRIPYLCKLWPVWITSVSQSAYLGNEDIASFLVRVGWQQQCSCFISHPQLTPPCCSTFSSVPISHMYQQYIFSPLPTPLFFIYKALFPFNKAPQNAATSEIKGQILWQYLTAPQWSL